MASLDTAGNGSWNKDQRAAIARGGAPLAVRLVKWAGFLSLYGCTGAVLGFFAFLLFIERTEPPQLRKADAIVALTGGADRISDALERLKSGSGQRLLISGVAHDMTRERLAQQAPALRSWLKCCIDLGHAAQNTVGNAKETRHWMQRNGYRSLVVVTSSYHMPRAMVELRRKMPGIELIAAPVVTEKLRAMDFWQHPGLLRTIGTEYMKFVVAYVRASLTPTRPMDDITAQTTRRQV
jgi:uncharacterized SAM-binding protein YcdF (DUF218 family)